MKFSCDKNILSEAVSRVGKIGPAKANIHAVEGIYLQLFDDGIGGGRLPTQTLLAQLHQPSALDRLILP